MADFASGLGPCSGSSSFCLESATWGFIDQSSNSYSCASIGAETENEYFEVIRSPWVHYCHMGDVAKQKNAPCLDYADADRVIPPRDHTLCAWSDGGTAGASDTGFCTTPGATNGNGATCQRLPDACPYHCELACLIARTDASYFTTPADTCLASSQEAALAGSPQQSCCVPFPPSPPPPSPPPPSPPLPSPPPTPPPPSPPNAEG